MTLVGGQRQESAVDKPLQHGEDQILMTLTMTPTNPANRKWTHRTRIL